MNCGTTPVSLCPLSPPQVRPLWPNRTGDAEMSCSLFAQRRVWDASMVPTVLWVWSKGHGCVLLLGTRHPARTHMDPRPFEGPSPHLGGRPFIPSFPQLCRNPLRDQLPPSLGTSRGRSFLPALTPPPALRPTSWGSNWPAAPRGGSINDSAAQAARPHPFV